MNKPKAIAIESMENEIDSLRRQNRSLQECNSRLLEENRMLKIANDVGDIANWLNKILPIVNDANSAISRLHADILNASASVHFKGSLTKDSR